jgi:hypothetical protein
MESHNVTFYARKIKKVIQILDCAYGQLVGNGHCNDEANSADCLYDGGECCGGCVNTDHCSDCLCYDGGAFGADTSCKCYILIAILFSLLI